MTESACNMLDDLRARYRGTPILTLAQTALWDDPIKAAFKRLVDREGVPTRLVLGIMDTDYFSRLPKPPQGLRPVDVLPHNDTTTRDLWSAVGEMHSLLGAETPLTLHTLAAHGVGLCRIAALMPEERKNGWDEFLNRLTEAWGWRGLAQTRGRRMLAGDVPLKDAGAALLNQLEWAISETARTAGRPLGEFSRDLMTRAADFVARNPGGSLTDLYLALLPMLYGELLGYAPEGLEYTRASELLRFNRWTANRARFRPLDLFLNPETAPLVKRHYSAAVHGSGIAALDRFGPDALPFDVAIPGRGRGTLHIGADYVRVDTDDPVEIALESPLRSRRELAVVLEDNLGAGVALLGKAVVLITMLAQEYIFLFNETGSPYVTRSCRWNSLLSGDGLGMRLYPILRLGVRPWDTVSRAGGSLALPPHMAKLFAAPEVSAADFQAGWRDAARRAEASLAKIKRLPKTVDWLDHLSRTADAEWTGRAGEYSDLRKARAEHGLRIREINQRSRALVEDLKRLKTEVNALEKDKGRHFRACVMPLRQTPVPDEQALATAMVRRAEYHENIAALRGQIDEANRRRREVTEERRALQQHPSVSDRERGMRRLEAEAEREKAQQVHDAWMTAQALEHSQARPTAWWFPAVDPGGNWFRAVADTAEFRWQALTGESCADQPVAPLPDIVSI